jgi:hypothetical protein
LCILLLITIALIRAPLYNSDPNRTREVEVVELSSVVFEDIPMPIVSDQSVVPNAPAKPSIIFRIDEVDPEEIMEIDLQGIDVIPADFQGRIMLRPDTPIRVLTILEPTFDELRLPDAWRGKTVQVRILIGLHGEVRHTEIVTTSLPDMAIKSSVVEELKDKIDAALAEWVFRPARHDGQEVLSYTVQTFRL